MNRFILTTIILSCSAIYLFVNRPASVLAMVPPAYDELCSVVGLVEQAGFTDISSDLKKKLMVPTVVNKLIEIKPSGVHEPTYLDCKLLKEAQEVSFRNCDDFSFNRGEKVQGLVGRSKGVGPHCISDVTRLPFDGESE